MKKRRWLIWILIFSFSSCFALTSPQLRCLEVADNGNVTLHWLAPTDMSGFLRYEVFYSNDLSAPFTQIDVIANSSTVNYLHAGANANGQNCYYYITSISSTSTFFSDTLATIEFYLTNPGNGTALLNWSPPRTPLLATHNTTYDIYKEFPTTVWQHRGTAPALMFRDTIDVCDAAIGYRVELSDASGCKNVSRIMSGQFSDMIPPAITSLDSVSVDINSRQIILGWSASQSSDAVAYIIYYDDDNLWIPLDTLYGIHNTFWIDTLHNPVSATHRYRIAVLDSCWNSSPMSTAQRTMQLSSTYDRCSRQAFLTWTPYENMRDNLEKYEIYFSINEGPILYDGYSDASVRSYTFENLIPENDYCFFVKAVNQAGNITASSTQSCFTYAVQDNNDFAYIRSVSVTDDDEIEIIIFTGTTVNFEGVVLYKREENDTAFKQLTFLDYKGSNTYIFLDKDVKVNYRTYYYKAVIKNDCLMETVESNISHNMILTTSTFNYANFLNWTDYENWNGSVGNYVIQRKDEMNTRYEEVGSTLRDVTRFEDNVINFPKSGDRFIYRIEAQENGPNEYGFNDISYSNKVVAYQEPIVYIPNAFRPKGGITRIFKPATSFVPVKDYGFYIYSREGTLIFETHDPEEGWNGQENDDFVQGAVYIYKIQFSFGREDYYENIGTVTVIR